MFSKATHVCIEQCRTADVAHLVLEGLEGVGHVEVEADGVEQVPLAEDEALLPLGHQLARLLFSVLGWVRGGM